MNEITWLIYFGEVAESIVALSVISGFVLIICAVCMEIVRYERFDKPALDSANKKLAALGFSLFFFASFIPSKQFFYIVAAGSAMQQAVNSDIGEKVLILINKKLDKAIGEHK